MLFELNTSHSLYDSSDELFNIKTQDMPISLNQQNRYILTIDLSMENIGRQTEHNFSLSTDKTTLFWGKQWIGSIIWCVNMPYLTLNDVANVCFKQWRNLAKTNTFTFATDSNLTFHMGSTLPTNRSPHHRYNLRYKK